MSGTITLPAFLETLSRSKLLDELQTARMIAWLSSSMPYSADVSEQSPSGIPAVRDCNTTSAEQLSHWLRTQGWVTAWQNDKLLQGKHRGFLLGDYILEEKIARGGMSTIYAARHRISGLRYALKVLPLSKTHRASYLPRFKREAQLAVRLQHPNIVRVYQLHEENDGRNDVYFMAMELLPGRDLYDIVNADGPLPCRLAASYIEQAARGLQHAHDTGLVHRDIKPGNLFLHDDGTIRLLDLGLANDYDSEESLTRDYNERVLGTADYLSPEQALDSHLADARSDIYGLGCTFYFLLTGRPPFHEGSLAQRILAHQLKTPKPVSDFRNDVPKQLTELLQDMMEKSSQYRIQSALAVADRLQSWLLAAANAAEFDRRPQPLNLWKNNQCHSAEPSEIRHRGSGNQAKHRGDNEKGARPTEPASPAGRSFDQPTDPVRSLHSNTTPLHPDGARTATKVVDLQTDSPEPMQPDLDLNKDMIEDLLRDVFPEHQCRETTQLATRPGSEAIQQPEKSITAEISKGIIASRRISRIKSSGLYHRRYQSSSPRQEQSAAGRIGLWCAVITLLGAVGVAVYTVWYY
ncbi:MAG: serine/threonine protein kinase [Planctomycetaceae bacterium]|nr:serine/threonine protein kinase [Planctomycetaceae bacterium]